VCGVPVRAPGHDGAAVQAYVSFERGFGSFEVFDFFSSFRFRFFFLAHLDFPGKKNFLLFFLSIRCMCGPCASELRRAGGAKCPICRVRVEALLHIRLQGAGATTAATNAE